MDDQKARIDELNEAKRRLLQQRIRGLNKVPQADIVQPRATSAKVPISAEQHRIWLHANAQPDLPLYNEPITIHRSGPFNPAAFEAAFNEVLRRHEAWRTSFSFVNGELLQVIHPDLRVSLPLVDLTHLSESERVPAADRLAAEDSAEPIDIEHAPLFRAKLIRLGPEQHRLHLTLHHIIFDGVSIYRILMPELTALYEAFAASRPSPFPEPKLQYGDYALWRQQHLASKAIETHLQYWRDHLAGELPILQLPLDRPRPMQITHRGSMEVFQISAGLLNRLRQLARDQGATLYMVLLAAYKVLLFRYSGQQDIVVGGATDARRRPELEPLMGYFLDTITMRTHPDPSQSFADFLPQVRNAVLGALGAADVPFDRVVQAIRPRRDSSYHPIFQVFFSIEPPVDPFPEGWDLTQMDVTMGSAKFDLYLELDERPDHMAARFLYNTDIFDPATIRRMADHWLVILDAVSRAPETAIASLPILTPAELTQLTGPNGWNDTASTFPQLPLHKVVAAQAARTPDAPAVTFGPTTLTYAQLDQRATTLAARLSAAGVGPGTTAAVLLSRSEDLLAGLLAVLKTGAAYLPLDPETPSKRLAQFMADAKPAAILTGRDNLNLAGPFDTPAVLIEQDAQTAPLNVLDSSPEDLAYVIYTSGTTGQPKGVEISHRAIVNLLTSMQAQPGFMARDTLLAVTTVSFDIAALELFLPLISGGKVVIASREQALDPTLLAGLIASSSCTVMQATPATWRALLASGWTGSPSLKRILCGGEPLPRELAERLLNLGLEVWNVYGPTETTVWSTVEQVQHGSGSVPIGRPIANTLALTVDAQLNPVPVGVIGELLLGGSGVARGYRNLDALTAQRFVNVPTAANARMYRTGDLAVRRADGRLECLGRLDNQVKVRGFRVELEAVEAAVTQHPHIAAAAARTWPDAAGGMRLSVCITARGEAAPTPRELRDFLAQSVPDFMVPSDVVLLQSIPLTPNGKTDRAALPSPVPGSELTVERTALATTYEERLAVIWSELLGVDVVSASDSFFDLGGHSLLVATLQNRIKVAFGEAVPMAALFHLATLRQQAELLETRQKKELLTLPPSLIPIQEEGTRSPIFWLHPTRKVIHLAAALGNDQPLYGVVLTRTQMDELGPAPSMQQIAALHVRAILQAQPTGPFVLGGLCTGGIVAYEIASQLSQAGHEVPLLLLLDSINPVFFRRLGSLRQELSKIRFHLRRTFSGNKGDVTLAARLLTRLGIAPASDLLGTEMKEAEQLTDSAAYRYHPPAYAGNVQLLQPVERPDGVDFQPGWATVAPTGLTALNVKGSHDQLLDPTFVDATAQVISAQMQSQPTRGASQIQRARNWDTAEQSSRIVLIPAGNSAQAIDPSRELFLIPGNGDDGSYFRRLARELGESWSVSLVRPQNTRHRATLNTFEEAAIESAEAIRASRPEGPYVVGGYCYGGVIAFETARRLAEQGCETYLILCDTPVPGYPQLILSPRHFRAHWPFMRAVISRTFQEGTVLSDLGKAVKKIAWRALLLARPLFAAFWGDVPPKWIVDQVQAKDLPFFRLRSTHVPILHLLANEREKPLTEYIYLGWQHVAEAGLTLRRISGTHVSFFTESTMPQLAEAIESWAPACRNPGRGARTFAQAVARVPLRESILLQPQTLADNPVTAACLRERNSPMDRF